MIGDQSQDQMNHNEQVYATSVANAEQAYASNLAQLDFAEKAIKIGAGLALLYVIYLFARK